MYWLSHWLHYGEIEMSCWKTSSCTSRIFANECDHPFEVCGWDFWRAKWICRTVRYSAVGMQIALIRNRHQPSTSPHGVYGEGLITPFESTDGELIGLYESSVKTITNYIDHIIDEYRLRKREEFAMDNSS